MPVSHTREPCKTDELVEYSSLEMPFRGDSGGPKNNVLDGVEISPREAAAVFHHHHHHLVYLKKVDKRNHNTNKKKNINRDM